MGMVCCEIVNIQFSIYYGHNIQLHIWTYPADISEIAWWSKRGPYSGNVNLQVQVVP